MRATEPDLDVDLPDEKKEPALRALTEKAAVLIEALPYIRTFFGRTFVVKYGGSAMSDPALREAVMRDLVLLKYVGLHPVVVHGGGPEISKLMARLNKKAEFVDGLRVTDAETMELTQMVLIGKVNANLVALANRHGGRAVGMSGHDGGLIHARKLRPAGSDASASDLGYVGEVESIDTELLRLLSDQGYMPVVASVGVGEDGYSLNINADVVAGELAAALGAEKLIYLTDVDGIIRNMDGDDRTVLPALPTAQAHEMIAAGDIVGGMIPKVKSCMHALSHGVHATHIVDGRALHSVLLEIFTDEGVGTMVVP